MQIRAQKGIPQTVFGWPRSARICDLRRPFFLGKIRPGENTAPRWLLITAHYEVGKNLLHFVMPDLSLDGGLFNGFLSQNF